jgi:lysophospholipase L1-like esterase
MLQVGRDRNYPDRAPWCAWAELYSYSVKKPQPIPGLKAVQKEEGDRVGKNLGAIAQMQHICQDQQAQLLIALSPLKREVHPGVPRNYEQVARERLDLWAHEHHVPYLDLLERFNQTCDTPDLPAKYQRDRLYRDHIHLSPLGNQLVSRALAQWLQRLFPEELSTRLPPSSW